MPEKFQPPMRLNLVEHEYREPSLLRDWLNAPVFLASTSQYRKDRLVDVGFKPEKITAIPTSDEDERLALDTYKKRIKAKIAQEVGMDNYFTEGSIAVAIAKVDALLKKETIPDNALVIAADTVTHIFDFPENNHSLVWDAFPSDKPADLETARAQIKSKFNTIIAEYALTRCGIHEVLQTTKEAVDKTPGERAKLLETIPEMLIAGTPELKITVSTGVALRLPKQKNTEFFIDEVDLVPTAIFNLVDKKLGNEFRDLNAAEKQKLLADLSPDIDRLIEEIIAENSEIITKVSGGIPFHDPKVRETLGIKLVKDLSLVSDFPIDEGVFKGMPGKKLKKYLQKRATELSFKK